jgi:hypothetical protein
MKSCSLLSVQPSDKPRPAANTESIHDLLSTP